MKAKLLLSIFVILFSINLVYALSGNICGGWWGDVTINGNSTDGVTVVSYNNTNQVSEYINPSAGMPPFGNYSIQVDDNISEKIYFIIGNRVADNGLQDCDFDNHNLFLTATDEDNDTYSIAFAGYTGNLKDCDDSSSSINPDRPEVPGNFINDDCNASTYDWDADNDTYNNSAYENDTAKIDCNDTNAAIHPGAAEICGNGIDDDCDGVDDSCPAPPAPTPSAGGGGGGGGGTPLCTENWTCTNWGECAESGTQTRICTDVKKCGTTKNKPVESQSCTYIAPVATGGEATPVTGAAATTPTPATRPGMLGAVIGAITAMPLGFRISIAIVFISTIFALVGLILFLTIVRAKGRRIKKIAK